jgi:hypothetical protein
MSASCQIDQRRASVKSQLVCNSASSSRLITQLAMSIAGTSSTSGSASIKASVSGRK